MEASERGGGIRRVRRQCGPFLSLRARTQVLLEVGDRDLHQPLLGGIDDAAVDEPQPVLLEVTVGHAEPSDDVGDGYGAFALRGYGAQDFLVLLGEGGQRGKEDVLSTRCPRRSLSVSRKSR